MTGEKPKPLQTVHDIHRRHVRESMLPVEHERRCVVARKNGVCYMNDSGGTNVNSAWYTLSTMERPVLWITGGAYRPAREQALHDEVREKVRMILFLGLSDTLLQRYRALVPVVLRCGNMHEAVVSASVYAEPDDVVLLCPASPAVPGFSDAEALGNAFNYEVARL